VRRNGKTDGPRTAFPWRLTLDEADTLDALELRLRRQLGRGRLDKAVVLLTLVAAGVAQFDTIADHPYLHQHRHDIAVATAAGACAAGPEVQTAPCRQRPGAAE
jgi:hypothetical protein